ARSSINYIRQFKIKYKVQVRQLRKSHPDTHYCCAIFKYLCHFAVKFRDYVALIFGDDKHKVLIGEDVATSTGVRNNHVAISTLATLNAKELSISIEDIQKNLDKRTQRLKLHDNYFLTGYTATDIEIEQFFEEHYKEFDDIFGQLTSEKYRLTEQKVVNKESQAGVYVNTKIWLLVCCDFCGKYRCIYSDTCLSEDNLEMIAQYLENISYSCGSPIFPDDHLLFEQLHIRQNLTCDSPIERNYYSCCIKDVDLCYWCGAEDGIIEPSEDLKSQFKTIYPLCISCEANDRKWSTHAPIVFQSKNKK
ncbi:5573_t:CDS:2, partial [Racocetra persica]